MLRLCRSSRSIPFPLRSLHAVAHRTMASCSKQDSAVLAAANGTTQPSAASTSAATKVQQPLWNVPQPTEQEPKLVVYNSLTRTKTPFVPKKGRHVTWYNCGPTVYDSSHMGHARNYVTQDIMRRILEDYLGYDVQFVMNITDIDDKIIVRARQAHLLKQLRSEHEVEGKGLSQELLSTVRKAWSTHFAKTLKPLAPPAPPGEVGGPGGSAPEDDAAWEELSRLKADPKRLAAVSEKEPKFSMWWTALETSRQAQIAAVMSLGANDHSVEAAQSLIDASADVLSAHLDKELGATVTDPSIFRDLAAFWEGSFFDDMARLHVRRPTTLTRVSEYVPEIVSFVQRIIDNGYAYADDSPGDGKQNVWFDTRAFDGGKPAVKEEKSAATKEEGWNHTYAKLAPWSKGNRDLLEEGEGSLSTAPSTTSGKRTASDFALWKTSKPGEPAWPSPWGPGRPGWHIECSVMASEVLGEGMDVHSGGVDLMFPHHDNEIAQSEAFHDCRQWVNYFLHTGHLHIEGLKMSKSLKNFISIDEALNRFSARQLRLAFLLQSWSSRMDFRESAMAEVRSAEATFNNFFASTKAHVRNTAAQGVTYSDGTHHYGAAEKELAAALASAQLSFRRAMCDSFDTPTGLAVLQDIVSRANVYERGQARKDLNVGVLKAVAAWVGQMLRMLGLGEGPVREGELGWGDAARDGAEDEGIDREALLTPYLEALSKFRDTVRALARSGAPHSELLQLADRLRDGDMVDLGVALEDQEDGRALVKLVPAATLQAAREEKERAAADKVARKAEAAQKAAAKRRETLEKGRAAPADVFAQLDAAEYGSQRDERGIPTHDAQGAELSKKKRKNLEKDWEKQGKLHEDFLKAKEAGEIQ